MKFKENIIDNIYNQNLGLKKSEIEEILEIPPDDKLGDFAFPRLDAARSGGLLIEIVRPAPHSRPPSTRFETVLANEASDTGSLCIPS